MKRLDLSRLYHKFNSLTVKYLKDHNLTQQELAKFVGLQQSQVNALLNGKRKLTGYYLLKFITKGVIKVEEIKNYETDIHPRRETGFWEIAEEAQNYELLHKITVLKKRNVDIYSIINNLYEATGNKK